MRHKKIILFSFLFSFCFAKYYNYGNEFFRDGENARISALGGLSDIYINLYKCILYDDVKPSIYFSNKNKSNLAKIKSFSILLPHKKKPTFIKLINRTVDGIFDTNSSWSDDGDNIPEASEINYFKIKEIQQNEIGISLTTLRVFKKHVIGISFKPNFINLAEYSGYGFSFDLMSLKKISQQLNFIIIAEDLFAFKSWNTDSFQKFPFIAKTGIFYNSPNIKSGIYISKNFEDNNSYHYNLGLEMINNNIYYRLGTSHENRFSMGIGFKTSIINIDYGYLEPIEKNFMIPSQILSIKLSLDYIDILKGKIKP